MIRIHLAGLICSIACVSSVEAQLAMPPETVAAPPIALPAAPPEFPGVQPNIAPAPVVVPPEAATVTPPPKVWEGSVELGLNGTDGNSKTFNLHTGGKIKRKTDLTILSSELEYLQNSNNSVETANRAFLESRFEYLFANSPWTWFVHNTLEYDEFKAYDLRLGLDTGVGYRWIKSDTTTFTTRLGGGTSREFGSTNERWRPEGLAGLDFEHKLGKRHKFTLTVDYMPDVTAFATYRVNSKAAWQLLLDEEMNLSLKLGVNDRYDSAPTGVSKANDIDYLAMLLWSF